MTDTSERTSVAEEAPPPADEPGEADRTPRRPGRFRAGALICGLGMVCAGIPTAIALGVLHNPRWYPLLDLAQTEMRLRDFTNGHPPLIGLASRVNGFGKQGSHPGPLEFWAMWPFYKLYGSSSFAFQAAGATVNLVAACVAVWIGHRRGGLHGALAVATLVAVLGHSLGPAKLVTEPWVPYTPLLWWVVFLLALWSLLGDDLEMLPVAVFAGSFCAQTHVPYTALVGCIGAVTAAIVVVRVVRKGDPSSRRRLVRWGGGSLVLLALLWAPPIVEQFTTDPGNFSVIVESFTNPAATDKPVGLGSAAVHTWLAHLNLWDFLDGPKVPLTAPAGSPLPGLGLLAVWLGTVALAWRARRSDLLRLHLVVALALVFGLVSIARILGMLWYYLVLWSWVTTGLLLVASLWTIAAVLPSRFKAQGPSWAPTAALGACLLVASAVFGYDAAFAEAPAAVESRTVGELLTPTVAALRSGEAPGTGPDGRYVIDVGRDGLGIGGQGWSMLLELERAGIDVGIHPIHASGAVPHRVREAADATAIVYYVVGQAEIDRTSAEPDMVEIASYEQPAEARRRYERLYDDIEGELRERGLDDLADGLAQNLLVVAISDRLPEDVQAQLIDLRALGQPAAVFVGPPATN